LNAEAALLDAKLALEEELKTPLSYVFLNYIVGKQEGMTQFARASWLAQLASVLLHHYARVTCVVTGRVPKRPQTPEDAAIGEGHAQAMRRRANSQAQFLLGSVDREWDRTPEEKADVQRGFMSRMLGKAREVWRRTKARLSAVLATETNGAAEDARIRQAREIAGNRPLYKWWSTMLDEKVRPWHQAAEGQERPIADPFTVGEQSLMFPGDMALGATLNNIINCRCSAVYYALNPDGSKEELSSTPRLTPVKPNRSVGSVDHPSLITRQIALRSQSVQRVFLEDMLEARVSIYNGIIRVTRGGQRLAIGRYTHTVRGGSKIEGLQVEPAGQGIGIEDLIKRSVQFTNDMRK
jgi:hypothetical protein